MQLNSLRPTNDAFCASLRTRLKASLPMMKSLKPFSHTFFSEYFLEQIDGMDGRKSEPVTPAEEVNDLIQLGDEKKALDDQRDFTTEHGTGRGHHGGL